MKLKLIISFSVVLSTILALIIPTEFQLNSFLRNMLNNQKSDQSYIRPSSTLPTLTDLLTLQRGSLFYDYVREVADVVS